MKKQQLLLAALALTMTSAVPAWAQSLDDIYLMTRPWMGSLVTDVFYFDRSGTAVRAPNYDIRAYGADQAAQQDPGMVGSYSVGGGSMRVDWLSGDVSEASFEPSDNCFYWDGGLFCPVDAFRSGSLSGEYYGGDAIGGGTSAFASGGRTIYFSPDGGYAMASSLSVDMYGGGVDASASSGDLETGSYEVEANSMVFFPDNGQPSWSTAAFPYHDDGEGGEYPNRIYFDGVMMTRQ